MKIKKEYIILGGLIIVLCLYLIFHKTDQTNYKMPEIPDIAKKDISKIEINKTSGNIILILKNNKWYIQPENYLVNNDKIDTILKNFDNLSLTALISEAGDYSRYDLDKENKISVKAYEGDTIIRDFDIGKTASSYRHTFIKLTDNKRVFHGKGSFRSNFDETIDDLRDKTVLSFDKSLITEINFFKNKRMLQLKMKELTVKDKDKKTKPNKIWEDPKGKKANNSKIKSIISTLENLKCESFIKDKKKEDFKNPLHKFVLKGAKEYQLFIFKKADENYPAISSESDYPFLLPSWQTENLTKNVDNIFKK